MALLPLTLFRVVLLHGADEVRSRVEVMGAGLLEAPQAVEGAVSGCAAREGPSAGDAGETRPALHFQVEGLKRRHGQLALTPTCSRIRYKYGKRERE